MKYPIIAVSALLVVISGCSWQEPAVTPVTSAEAAAPLPTRQQTPSATIRRSERQTARVNDPGMIAATAAQQQIGVAYRYGGSDTSGFDCSGLVQYAYQQAGIAVPRTTGQQFSAVRAIGADAIQPGDVLFFDISGKPSHVGIYVGEGFFVHAPSTGRTVSTERLSDRFYRSRLLKIGRFTP